MLSPHYNSKSKVPYFEQVFDILGKIGEGSFGEVRCFTDFFPPKRYITYTRNESKHFHVSFKL